MNLNREGKEKTGCLEPVSSFTYIQCDYKPEDGLIIEFKDNDGYKKVLLSRNMARQLASVLDNVEFSWRAHERFLSLDIPGIES